MKAVLISIQPKWCELIASGKKTVEVRKTKPKLETPFKCYIYCTKGEPLMKTAGNSCFIDNGYRQEENLYGLYEVINGKVIGEFVCDTFITDRTFGHDALFNAAACMSDAEVAAYCTNNEMYGWHISDLVIYDKPKELSKFIIPSKFGCVNEGKCRGCIYLDRGNGYNVEDDCNAWFCTDDYKPLRKAPQSWCYCEDRRADNEQREAD